ncbi:MAG: hypothetical protein R3213_13000, partial [Flavobacteriaceae bacterium]|nr:hypothetical protein [Flavobacteriaceae bacterium]
LEINATIIPSIPNTIIIIITVTICASVSFSTIYCEPREHFPDTIFSSVISKNTMAQDISQRFFLWGIFLILGVFVLMWLLQRRCDYCKETCNQKEDYSPYRRTGGCPPRTGNTYLDAYEQEEYYRKYPYIYPTPTNYVRALYGNKRAEMDFIEAERIALAQKYLDKYSS